MKNVKTHLNEFLKDIIKIVRKPVMSILPGQLSFFLLLSMIPIVLIIGIISSYISISTNDIIKIVNESLPANTSSLIVPLLQGQGMDYNILLLIISALLLVSKGSRSIMRVASIIYDTKDKISIRLTIKSYVLSLLLVMLFMFILVVPLLGSKILYFLSRFKIISLITDNLINIYDIIKWPITLCVLFINLKIIYVYSPNKKIPHSSVNRGTIFTSVGWVISTALYSYYVTHLTKYNVFYGGASNIIILMLWVYLISYIFVLGMGINAGYIKNKNDLQEEGKVNKK